MSILDKFKLTGRVALITGGNRGLGRQMAQALAEAGAQVALTSREQERAELAAGEIARSISHAAGDQDRSPTADRPPSVRGYACDVSDTEQSAHVVQQVIADFGGLHILVNNAGINIRGPIEKSHRRSFNASSPPTRPAFGTSAARPRPT